MDFDALVLFYNNFKSNLFSEEDIPVMSSSLINGGIDINKSVNDNIVAYAVYTKDQSALEMLDRESEVLNLPIYRILLEHKEFFNTILTIVKRKGFDNVSFQDLVECLIDSLTLLDEDEVMLVLTYLIDLINSRGRIGIEFLQESVVVRKFIKTNLDSLYLEKNKRLVGNAFYKKVFIIKLFSFGAVCFGDKNGVNISYEDIMVPLIRTQNYSRLKVLINSKAIPFVDCDYVKNLVNRYLSYNIESAVNTAEVEEANEASLKVESALNLIKTTHIIRNM